MKSNIKEILAPMSPMQRISYIWDYYKLPILGTIAAIILLIFLIGNPPSGKKEAFLRLSILGKDVNRQHVVQFQEHLTNKLVTDKGHEEVIVQSISNDDSNLDQSSQVERQKFAAELATGDIDLIIIEHDLFEKLLSEKSLLPLNDLKGFNKMEIRDKALLKSGEKVYGIGTSDMKGLTSLDLDENMVICVPKNTKNLENIKQLLTLINSAS
ncbi:hypothetical protein [Neobacillus sp. Marseille-QA0830]